MLLKTLEARYYTDHEVFREEMERFFFGMWVCAGRTEQIQKPGDYFLAEVAGESVIVTRDSEGGVRAFYNVCRHRGTQICKEGVGKLPGRIQCPYHAWTYDFDGRLIGAPHMDEVPHFRKADYPLAGQTWHQRTVIQPTSADAMTAASYLSFGQVPEWKAIEMKYTRRP